MQETIDLSFGKFRNFPKLMEVIVHDQKQPYNTLYPFLKN
jgi:hypothetical protein